MDNSQRIKTASRKIKKICSVLIFCLPLSLALYWFFFNEIHLLRSFPFPVMWVPTGLIRFLAFLIEMIPLSVVLYGLLRLRKLFLLYENGMIFTEKNVSCFRSQGRVLIIWVICHVIKTPLLSSLLVIGNPPEYRQRVMVFIFAHFICIFIGIIILAIAWAMDEARKIHEDQTLFI